MESGSARSTLAGGETVSGSVPVTPSTVARRMVVPRDNAVTTPSRFTEATAGSLEEYVNRLGSLLESYFRPEGHPAVYACARIVSWSPTVRNASEADPAKPNATPTNAVASRGPLRAWN